jgi:hypothetical protein
MKLRMGIFSAALLAIPLAAGAADLGGAPAANAEPAASVAAPRISGCDIGVGVGYGMGIVAPTGSTVGVGSDGEMVGPSLGCKLKVDNLVFGAQLSYDFIYGDEHKLAPNVGINSNFKVDAQLGLMTAATTMVYLHGGFTQLGLSGLSQSSVNGWEGGIGIETLLSQKLPLWGSLEATYSSYDVSKLTGTTGISADTFDAMARLKYKFFTF